MNVEGKTLIRQLAIQFCAKRAKYFYINRWNTLILGILGTLGILGICWRT
jgi:hypothetical protein